MYGMYLNITINVEGTGEGIQIITNIIWFSALFSKFSILEEICIYISFACAIVFSSNLLCQGLKCLQNYTLRKIRLL